MAWRILIQFSYCTQYELIVLFILLVHNVKPVQYSSPTRLWLLWCCTRRAQALPDTLFYCPGWYRAFQDLRHTPSLRRQACCPLLWGTVDCGTEVAELPRICLLGFDAWECCNCSERKSKYWNCWNMMWICRNQSYRQVMPMDLSHKV